ncbi:MAG: DUF494 family protein [Bacteroidota bacterium]
MKERVVEILVYLMAEIDANKRLSEIDLDDLKSKGYTQSEISAAFSWLYDNLPVQDGVVVRGAIASKESRRVLHDAEKLMMTTDAQGYLMQLCEVGLLENRDLENVIERAMMSGFEKLSMYEMREIVAAVLFARSNNWYESRSMLNNNDTIH